MPVMGLVLAVLGVALGFLVATVDASEPSRQGQFLVGVVLDATGPGPERQAEAIIDEATTIWRRHGVSLVRLEQDGGPVDVTVRVTFTPVPQSAAVVLSHRLGGAGLGAISFDEYGQPARLIVIDYGAVVATVRQYPVDGRKLSEWPSAFADRVVARAVGRVLAHEIGHFLLRFPAHHGYGLMRSAFNGRQLAYLDRGKFALSPQLLLRLQHQLAVWRSEPRASTDTREPAR
jgi:hypothetical protein